MTKQNQSQTLLVDPDALSPNPWNSNHVSPENEEKLDESVRRMGLFKPVIVRQIEGLNGYQILGGQHRWEAAQRLGMQVPIFNVGYVDDARAKEISLADNARYGTDDAIQLAAILEDVGDNDTIQSFLPYTDTDITSIFASVDIALDELDIDEPDEPEPELEKPLPKPAKTHTVMRFKVPLGDAEKLTELIAKTQKIHGYTSGDELTNAGDALVHLLIGQEDAE